MQKSLIYLILDRGGFWASMQLLLNRAQIIYAVQEKMDSGNGFGARSTSDQKAEHLFLLHYFMLSFQKCSLALALSAALGQNCRIVRQI